MLSNYNSPSFFGCRFYLYYFCLYWNDEMNWWVFAYMQRWWVSTSRDEPYDRFDFDDTRYSFFFSILYSGIRITRNIYMYISSVHMILYNVVCVLRMLHCCWCYSPFPYLPMHCAKQCARRAVPHANRKHFRKTHNTQPLTYKPKFQFMRYNFNCHDSMVGLSFSPTTECINVHIP